MRRRFLDIIVLLSLMLCAATVLLWIRSWHGGQSIERVDPQRRIVVTSMYGLIQISCWDGGFSSPMGSVFELFHPPRRVWRQWAYWHGHADTIHDGADDWAYEPSLGHAHWWQEMGFDWLDQQIVPRPNTAYIHDWLPPRWSGRERRLSFPHWALLMPFVAILGITISGRIRLTVRRRGGLCPTCGYDLRASPERCPECGEVRASP